MPFRLDDKVHAVPSSRAIGGRNKNSLVCQQGFLMALFPQRTHIKSYTHLLQVTNREQPAKLVQADNWSHSMQRLQHNSGCFHSVLLCIQNGEQQTAKRKESELSANMKHIT